MERWKYSTLEIIHTGGRVSLGEMMEGLVTQEIQGSGKSINEEDQRWLQSSWESFQNSTGMIDN